MLSSTIGSDRPEPDGRLRPNLQVRKTDGVSVKFQEILEGHLLTIDLDQSHAYAGLGLRTAKGVNARIDAISLDGVPVAIRFHRISLRSGLQDADGAFSLGEIEAFSLEKNRLVLDGDFGCVELTAGRFDIEVVK